MGHSAGGVFTQLLLDRGSGAAAVATNSAPPEGNPVVPLSQIKSTFAVLRSPANRHKAVGLTHEQWHYAFTNTFSEEESRALYERYHVPASGGIFWDNILANVKPGHQDIWVDFKNDEGYAHLLPAQKGWEEIADYALDWALRHARQPNPT